MWRYWDWFFWTHFYLEGHDVIFFLVHFQLLVVAKFGDWFLYFLVAVIWLCGANWKWIKIKHGCFNIRNYCSEKIALWNFFMCTSLSNKWWQCKLFFFKKVLRTLQICLFPSSLIKITMYLSIGAFMTLIFPRQLVAFLLLLLFLLLHHHHLKSQSLFFLSSVLKVVWWFRKLFYTAPVSLYIPTIYIFVFVKIIFLTVHLLHLWVEL